MEAGVALAFFLLFARNIGVLGARGKPEGSPERQTYAKLRASLAEGNMPARLYAKWLTIFLDWVERFFGDAGMADRTLFPHAFGLQKPVPLWTAPAFDRCLFLALIYPCATIFVIWAVSGDVGPAEHALGLAPCIPGWKRGLLAGLAGHQGFILWRFPRSRKFSVWATADLVCAAFMLVADKIITGAGAWLGAFAVICACAVALGFADTGAFLGAGAGAGGFAVVVVVAFTILVFNNIAIIHRWHGVFLLLFLSAMILACLGFAAVLSSLKFGVEVGPLLLFLGLLTLLNAPFDWASLGLTRALLRRGLELGGWWPYLLALVDAALAGVIIALLALTMVIGVQAFDAAYGGGKPVLPLGDLFDGIATNPAAPKYWWAYALLLSSMIPSLINLVIGGLALTRGLPGLPYLLLKFMPDGTAVPGFDRAWMALVLTAQWFVGAFLGIVAQGLFAVGIIHYVIPLFGHDLLEIARAVAAFDLPARVAQLVAGTL